MQLLKGGIFFFQQRKFQLFIHEPEKAQLKTELATELQCKNQELGLQAGMLWTGRFMGRVLSAVGAHSQRIQN